MNEIEELKAKLANSERYVIHEYEPKTINEKLLFIQLNNAKVKLSYEQFLKGRDKKLTNDLLKEIDSLNLTTIREKYFRVEK